MLVSQYNSEISSKGEEEVVRKGRVTQVTFSLFYSPWNSHMQMQLDTKQDSRRSSANKNSFWSLVTSPVLLIILGCLQDSMSALQMEAWIVGQPHCFTWLCIRAPVVLFSIILHWKYAITVILFYGWRQWAQTDRNPWSTITEKLVTSLDLLQSSNGGNSQNTRPLGSLQGL